MTIAQAGIYSLLGISVVFAVLLMIMVILIILRNVVPATEKKDAAAAAPVAAAAPAAPPQPTGDMKAPGSGTVSLTVPDGKTAAIIMSAVAEETGMPLNQLKFVSIKEI